MIGAGKSAFAISAVVVLFGGVGCGAARRDVFDAEDLDAAAPVADVPSGSFADAGGADVLAPGPATVLYAHTNTTLFRIRPDDPALAPERVGDFDCVKGSSVITDVAVDRAGKLAGISQTAVYPDMQITGTTVKCGAAIPLDAQGSLYGAAFAPAGTLDPARETLIVAGTDGTLYAADAAGGLSAVGHFGDVPKDDGNGHTYRTTTTGKRWELSGDIVFFENNGAAVGFATVRDCPSPPSSENCNRTDTLVELAPELLSRQAPRDVTRSVRGLIVRSPSCSDASNTGYGSIYGVAAVGGDVFGFARSRREAGADEQALVVRISNVDGAACLVNDVTAKVESGWAGGGVSTLASVLAPPPK